MCSRNLLHIKIPFFFPPSAQWTWQSTNYNTATGRFFPETKIFNSGNLEIVAPSPRNNNPKLSEFFRSDSNSFPCSDHGLHPKYP